MTTTSERRPYSLRESDRMARVLRRAAHADGGSGVVAVSTEAALEIARLLDENAVLRAKHAIARKYFLDEVRG